MSDDLDHRVVALSNPKGLTASPIDCGALCGAKMKGFTLIHLLDLMDASGDGVATAWRQTLPSDVRPTTERRAITSVAWLPVELYFHGVTFLTERAGTSPRGGIGIGHQMASRDIGAFFRFVMGFTTPSTVLALSGRFWRSYFQVSSLNVVSSTPTSVVSEIRDWPLRDEVSLHEMAGSLVAWMEAGRAKNVRVDQFERLSASDFRICASWS